MYCLSFVYNVHIIIKTDRSTVTLTNLKSFEIMTDV